MALSDLDKENFQTLNEQMEDVRESLYKTLDDKLDWSEEANKPTLSMMALTDALAALVAVITMGREDARLVILDSQIRVLRRMAKWYGRADFPGGPWLH